MKKQETLGNVDLNAVYRCPMVRTGTKYPNEIEDIIDVKFVPYRFGGAYNIIPLEDGYDTKFFYDLYVDWLLYTKYITLK